MPYTLLPSFVDARSKYVPLIWPRINRSRVGSIDELIGDPLELAALEAVELNFNTSSTAAAVRASQSVVVRPRCPVRFYSASGSRPRCKE